MPITFNCGCGFRITAEDDQMGMQIPCPACQQLVTVPMPPPPPAPRRAPLEPAPALEQAEGKQGVSGVPSGLIDAKPLIHRTSTNPVSKVYQLRDQIYDLMTAAFRAEGVEAMVLKSPPYAALPAWVKCECWKKNRLSEQLTQRSTAVITIEVMPFYRFEEILSLSITVNGKTTNIPSVIQFGVEDARNLARCLLLQVKPSAVRRNLERCRMPTDISLKFWLPKNKLLRLRQSWIDKLLWCAFVVSFLFLPLLPVVIIILVVRWKLRKHHVLSVGKPEQEPRELVRMDSWQCMVHDLGQQGDKILADLYTTLTSTLPEGFRLEKEQVWYMGVDGKEERCQFVLTFRRAIAFIQIYQYSKDLYVGWDAHINCATWAEKPVGSGVDRTTKLFCDANTIYAAWHTPHEYDITDANCLLEWTHSSVTKLIKHAVADHKIDQDINFNILRGERQGISGKESPQQGQDKSVFSRFGFKRQG